MRKNWKTQDELQRCVTNFFIVTLDAYCLGIILPEIEIFNAKAMSIS